MKSVLLLKMQHQKTEGVRLQNFRLLCKKAIFYGIFSPFYSIQLMRLCILHKNTGCSVSLFFVFKNVDFQSKIDVLSLFFCETLFGGFAILSSKTWTFRTKRIFCLQKRGLLEQNTFSIKTAFFALCLIIATAQEFAFLSSKTWTFRAKRVLSSKTWTFRAKRLEKCRNLVFCDFFEWLFNTKSGSFCLQKRGLSEQNAFFVFKNVDF